MNQTKIVSGLHYKTGEPVQVHMTDGVIDRVEPLMNRTMEHAGDLYWIGPGFVESAAFMDLTVGLAKGAPADLITFSWDQCHNLMLHDVYKHVAETPAS
ncbi:hypothetical protein [Paenibacillus nasutitermitis]|uniref:Uncharacterized protein n=1 Tax=Paenibacillus nasutitermitis TaxID=1652958 RepID=A0A916Z9C1_9BACL|nr:hypothetical protein [Paenibacillus nasutitermitis]GGD82605.1 hypothetical protein GCM10010911_45950 [Paenibacillus nasutitermitis]